MHIGYKKAACSATTAQHQRSTHIVRIPSLGATVSCCSAMAPKYPPHCHRLTSNDKDKLASMESYSHLVQFITPFGYTIDDLRLDNETNNLVFPNDAMEFYCAYKSNRVYTVDENNIDYGLIGMHATFVGLSESALNNREFLIVQVDPKEYKFVIDVTPPDSKPENVRYVRVSCAKAITIKRASKTPFVRISAVMSAHNRDYAFSSSGLDISSAVCIPVRPHPQVKRLRGWSDVPIVCNALNEEKAPGYPFTVCVGFNLFADTDYYKFVRSDDATPLLCSYTCEMIPVLRDKKGCFIDISPDISPTAWDYKVFVPDPTQSIESFWAASRVFDTMVEYGLMPSGSFIDDVSSARNDSAVELGMIPPNLNACWPDEDAKSIVCTTLLDSGIDTMDKHRVNKFHAEAIAYRRSMVLQGTLMLSRNLMSRVGNKHIKDGGTMVVTSECGTICFACYVRITEDEAKICGGCGKARYCSRGCQMWHWKSHVSCCASKEERARRRENLAKAKEIRSEQVKRHDENEARLKAEENAKRAERKALAARERVRRANEEAENLANRERLFAQQALQPHRTGKDRKAKRTTEQELTHRAWVSEEEKAARTEAFIAHQELEHYEAEARKAKNKLDAMKKIESDMAKEEAVATQCIPCPESISNVISSAMKISQ